MLGISWFLRKRIISARVIGVLSQRFPMNTGVPQSSILEPAFFWMVMLQPAAFFVVLRMVLFFIDLFPQSTIRQAIINIDHDCTILSASLASDLGGISAWGSINPTSFNSLKTSLLSVSFERRYSPQSNFHYWICPVNNCLSYRGQSWFSIPR